MDVSELYDLIHWLEEQKKGNNYRTWQSILQLRTQLNTESLSDEMRNHSLGSLTQEQLTAFSEHFGIPEKIHEKGEDLWFRAV